MRVADIAGFSLATIKGFRTRALLTLSAMAIGVAAVIILTALGEGARRYVVGEFSSLGTNLIIVLPGRSETAGASPGVLMGETPRDLTIDDALALMRSAAVRRIAPLNVGEAPVSWAGLERNVPVMGSTAEFIDIRHLKMAQGSFLPSGDPKSPASVCVLGMKVRNELFGNRQALGEWVRIGDRRFRVIGVLASEGRSIGVDVDEIVVVPVASAQMLFNSPSLFRILIEARSRADIPYAKDYVTSTLRDRHQGEEDVTVVTQDAVLSTFDRILKALTLTVAGIGAISLMVAGILIMNVMLVSVSQRKSEIGLLMALGASQRQVLTLFLFEAGVLSLIGAAAGLILGIAGQWVMGNAFPALSGGAPWWSPTAAVLIALATGLLFGYLPAKRASRLEPVQALARR